MTKDNFQGQITNLKFRMDQVYKEFLDMGPRLKNTTDRLYELEKKSVQLHELKSFYDKFREMDNQIDKSQTVCDSKHNSVSTAFKLLSNEMANLKETMSAHSDLMNMLKLDIQALRKCVTDFMDVTRKMNASTVEKSKNDFESSIKDIRKTINEYPPHQLNDAIGKIRSEISSHLDRFCKNDLVFKTIDQRLSNVNISISKIKLMNRD